MRATPLFGLLAGLAVLAAFPGDAAADLRTNASGRWQYVSALGTEFGRLAGHPALLLQSGSTFASLAGAPAILGSGRDDEEDDDEQGSWLSSTYVVVLAGVGGGAYLASELLGGDDGATGSPTPTPTSGGPTSPPITNNPTGDPVTSPAPSTPETTTPEPVTMTLLATGLAGLGGAQYRRRRKSSDLG